MSNFTIGQRIVAGFAAIVVISAALGIFSIKQLRTISTLSTVSTTESLEGMDCVGRIEAVAYQNNLILIKDLMTKNEDLKADLELQLQTNLLQMATISGEYAKTKSTEQARASTTRFDAARQEYANNIHEVIRLSSAQKNQEAMELKQSKVDTFLTTVQAEEQANKQSGKTVTQQVQTTASKTQISILIGFTVTLIATLAIAWGIILVTNRVLGAVAQNLNDSSVKILAAASQVTSSSQALAEGSSQQATSIEESSSSLEELSSMTSRNSENTQKASTFAKEARTAADRGTNDMKTMSSAMSAIKSSSDDIAKIIKTIDEIAFQTNILALNAAVEAARAGEAGMGFAVVADEVRNLAQRSAQAAKETAVKIEGAINNTTSGVNISTKVSEVLNEIVNKARQVDELVAEVAVASNEQTQGIKQINAAVSQMDKVTQKNAAGAEQNAAAAQELNAQAAAMKASVAELIQLVGGKPSTGGYAPDHFKNTSSTDALNRADRIKTHQLHQTTGHSNGHAKPHKNESGAHRSEIPLEDAFKDF